MGSFFTRFMKTILTTLTILFTSILFGQFSRSFNLEQSVEFNLVNTIALQKVNDKLNFFDIKSSFPGTLTITSGELDKDGETSNYKTLVFNNFLGSNYALSGSALNSNNELVLAILYKDGTQKIAYVKINLLTHTIIDSDFPSTSYQNGFVRSQQKGDSLITYIGISGGGIARLSRSINNLKSHAVESIDSSLTYSGQRKLIELLIDDQQEYISVNNKLFKRNTNGTLLKTNISGPSFYSSALLINDKDEIVVFKSKYGHIFSKNLDSLKVVSIPLSGTNNLNNVEAIFTNSKYVIYSEEKRIVLDTNFYSLSSMEFFRLNPSGIYYDLNSFYVFGRRKDKTQNMDPKGFIIDYQATITLTVVIMDQGGLLTDGLREYEQKFKHNNYLAKLNHLNHIFSAVNTSSAGLTYEKANERKAIIFSSHNDLAGLDELQDTIGLSLSLHYKRGLLPGPSTTTFLNNQANVDKYNRGYYVSRAIIEEHMQRITNQDPTYKMPFGIREWPAHGNVSIGQPEHIAPFYDANNNAVYEPGLGEYPLIYGDQCVLTVFHQPDNVTGIPHIESHQYVFTFDCDTSEVLQNTFFVKQFYLSRHENLDSVYFGNFSDIDVGNYNDDYLGTNVSLSMIYGYNGDSFDEVNGGAPGFGDTIPAVGVQLLKGIKQYNDNTDNAVGINANESINGTGYGDGIIDNEYIGLSASRYFSSQVSFPFGNPSSQAQNYFNLQGKLQDGSPNYYGGIEIKHDYFGQSDPQFYTSEGINHGNNHSEITDSNSPGDRRIIGGSGPGRLHVSDTIELFTAYIIATDRVNISPNNSVNKLFEFGSELKSMVQNNNAGCGKQFTPYVSENSVGIRKVDPISELRIFPNPFNNQITIGGLEGESEIRIQDINGRLLLLERNTGDQITLDLSTLNPAMYILQASTHGKIWVYKIIKH